jgi:mannosyltransferase
VAACTALALALGFAHLTRRSLWQDEGFTWSTVDRSLPALFSVLARHEGFQILHSLVEWPANRISSTVGALRTPSVLAFGAAVPAVWLAGRRLFDERTGLLAALLFALNGFALQYAQEARGYMLATMLCTYAAALLAQHVLAPRRWSRVGWIVVSALAIYAHGFAVFGIASQLAAFWFLPADRRRELHWVRDGALIALLATPAIVAPVFQVGSNEVAFISKPGFSELRGLVWSMSGRTATAVPVIGFGVVVALVAAVRIWRNTLHSVDAFRFALPFLWLVAPSFLLIAISYVHPIWLERYAQWSVGAGVILAAFGLTRFVHGRAALIVVLVVAALASRGVVRWYDQPAYQDYRSAMTDLSAREHAGDAIIFTPDSTRFPSQFYLRSEIDLQALVPLSPAQQWDRFKTGEERNAAVGARAINRALAVGAPRLWIVSHTPSGDLAPRLRQLRGAYRVASDRTYTGKVEVILLVHR